MVICRTRARETHCAAAAIVSGATFPVAAEVHRCLWRAAHVVVADVLAARAHATKGTEGDVPAAAVALPAALIGRVHRSWVTHALMVGGAVVALVWAGK